MGRIAGCAAVILGLILASSPLLRTAKAGGCERRAASSCGCGYSQQCYYPQRQPWVPYAPQGVMVPSTAAYTLQPTALVSPQFVTGQAFSTQFAMPVTANALVSPQFVTSQSLLSPLVTSQALTSSSSGMSVRQLADALKAVAKSQGAESQSAKSESATCGGDTASRLDKLQADIDSLTSTSNRILKLVEGHEARLQALEAGKK